MILLSGWPVSDPTSPFATATNENKVFSPALHYFGRSGYPYYIPKPMTYNIGVRSSQLSQNLGRSIRFDERITSPVYYESVSADNPVMIAGQAEGGILVGANCLLSNSHVSLNNGMQWLQFDHDVADKDGIYMAPNTNTVYHIDSSNCYKCADISAQEFGTVGIRYGSVAAWTTQGAATWTDAAKATTRIGIYLSGSRLIAWRSNEAAGFSNDDFEIMISDDDGSTWTSAYRSTGNSASDVYPTIAYLSANNLVIAYRLGTAFTTYTTSDNGTNWTAASPGGTVAFTRFYVTPSGYFLCCATNQIHQSKDSGATFNVVESEYRLNSDFYFDSRDSSINTVEKVNDGTMYLTYTYDEGDTWNYGIVTTDGSNALIIGGSGSDYTPNLFHQVFTGTDSVFG